MSRFLLISIGLLSGCFYTDPINQRPSLDIHQAEPGAPIYRNSAVKFSATVIDPDGDSSNCTVTWGASACTGTDCDHEFASGADTTFDLVTPPKRLGDSPFDTLHIVLDARDNHGATARPTQTLDLNVIDQAPTLALRKDPRHAYVVNTPIGLYAKVGDADDGYEKVSDLDWHPYSPASNPPFTLTDLTVVQDGTDTDHYQYGKTFTPGGIGDWDIQVTATDPSGLTDVEHLPITVVADHPPCLAQWDPTATPVAGTTVPMSDPTLFQVLVVADDLDPYPSVPNDPLLGTTEFHWSIVPPNGTRQSLDTVTGNAVALDPDSYTPDDIVELRVEIQDRMHIAVNCPPTDLTCSVISDQSCLQRLSWRVEVR